MVDQPHTQPEARPARCYWSPLVGVDRAWLAACLARLEKGRRPAAA